MEQEHYIKKFNQIKNNSSQNWKNSKTLLGTQKNPNKRFIVDGVYVSNHYTMSNLFTKHFVEEDIINFEKRIPMNPNSMSLFYSTPDNVSGVVRELMKNGAPQDIRMKFTNLCTEQVTGLLALFLIYVLTPADFQIN